MLYDPGYVVSQRAYKKASTLVDDGQSLLQENDQWKKDAAELQKQLEELGSGIANDRATNQLVESLEDLGASIEHAGKVGINALRAESQGLYRDLLDVMLPRLIGLVKEIPVPRIEYKSEGTSQGFHYRMEADEQKSTWSLMTSPSLPRLSSRTRSALLLTTTCASPRDTLPVSWCYCFMPRSQC